MVRVLLDDMVALNVDKLCTATGYRRLSDSLSFGVYGLFTY
jgi:hypothetical protein